MMPSAILGTRKSNGFQPLKFVIDRFSENDLFQMVKPAVIFECDASNVVVFDGDECVQSCMLL
jgi:hypothetical protein